MPAIARRVPEENDLDDASTRRMNVLIDELPHKPVQRLDDPYAPEVEAWNQEVDAIRGQTWLEVPWFFAETYFYRRIIEAVGYFGPDDTRGIDPFEYQKRRGLEVAETQIESAAEVLDEEIARGWTIDGMARLLKADLWGNQVDLSLWPADDQDHPTHAEEDADAHVLIDDSVACAEHLEARGGKSRIDIILDNAGFELIGDLAVADYVLSVNAASEVVLHVKLHPTFVSDATEVDVRYTIETLSADSHEHTAAMGKRLAAALEDGRLILYTHPYWTSPLLGWQMPEDLRGELAESDLTIWKGDANYRRLLGDLAWPLHTKFDDVVAYHPGPVVALRTYKSEVGSGLHPDRVAELHRTEKDWLTSGRWGIIQASKLDRSVARPSTEVQPLESSTD